MKFLILFSLLPIIASVILKKFFSTSFLSISGKKTQVTVCKVCEVFLPSDIMIHEDKRLNLKNKVLSLPTHLYHSKNQLDHSEILPELGLILLGKGKNTWVAQQKSLLLFDTIFPSFSLVILIFGALAKSIPPQLAIALFFLSISITCLNALYITWIRHNAVELIINVMKSLPLYLKEEDESNFIKVLKTKKFQYSLPRCLSWIT